MYYKIINKEGCEIAYLTEEELEEYRNDGLIKTTDKIVEVES